MGTDSEVLYEVATRNRLLAADMFAGLDDDQWRTPSLCAGWTVREVLAHLVPPEGGLSLLGLVGQVVRFRGDLERMVDETTRSAATEPTASMVAKLRQRAGVRLDPPVVHASGPMTDTAIHLRDAARPLGIDANPPPDDWRPVLDFLVSKAARRGRFLPPDRLPGLRIVADDTDWRHGTGEEVRGHAEALALVLSGRPVALPELDGPGAAVLGARVPA